ncbi:MAG: MFS transporter, partial [bacterium]|nr:MFS transporter [bacterium]
KVDSNEKKILVFTSMGHFLTHFFMLVFPALVMPLMRHFSLPLDRVLAISFPMYLCYGLLAVPWGYLSDHLGPRKVMGAGIAISGMGFIAAGNAQTITQLTVFLSITGIGCSAYHPSGLALLTKGIKVRGKALGINGVWGNLGIATAPLAAGVLTYIFAWDKAFFIIGAVGVVIGIVSIAAPFSVSRNEDLQKGTFIEKRDVVRLFLLLCCVMLFSGLMYRGFTLILPTFLENRMAGFASIMDLLLKNFVSTITPDVKTLAAALITGAVFFMGMGGQLLGGRVADRRDLKWAYFFFFLAALPCLFLLGQSRSILVIVFAGFFVFFTLGMQPIENSLFAMLTPARWRSLSFGIKFTLVFGVGSLSVFLVNLVEGRYGLDYVIYLLLGYLCMILFFIALLIFVSRGTSVRHES